MWIYFVIIGLGCDLLGAYLIVRSLLRLNPLTKHVGNLFKIIIVRILSNYGMTPNTDEIDKMFEEIKSENKKIKAVKAQLKKLEEDPTKLDVNDKLLVIQQFRDALAGFLILVLGCALQIIANLIQYYCSRPEIVTNLPQWCKF